MVNASAYLFPHFRKGMVLQQDFKERHTAAFMITKIRSFKREKIFFGGGGGGGAYSWYFTVYVYGTVSSKITLVIHFQIFQDKQKKTNAHIEMYGSVPNNFMMDSPI